MRNYFLSLFLVIGHHSLCQAQTTPSPSPSPVKLISLELAISPEIGTPPLKPECFDTRFKGIVDAINKNSPDKASQLLAKYREEATNKRRFDRELPEQFFFLKAIVDSTSEEKRASLAQALSYRRAQADALIFAAILEQNKIKSLDLLREASFFTRGCNYTNEFALYERGRIQGLEANEKELALAEKSFLAAAKIAPGHVGALTGFSQIALLKNNKADAVKTMQSVITSVKADTNARLTLIDALLFQANHDLNATDIKQAADLAAAELTKKLPPQLLKPTMKRAFKAFFADRRTTEAKKLAEQVEKTFPKDPELLEFTRQAQL